VVVARPFHFLPLLHHLCASVPVSSGIDDCLLGGTGGQKTDLEAGQQNIGNQVTYHRRRALVF